MKFNKILITGGAGYVGSYLISEALKNKFKVRCIDLLIYGEESLKNFHKNKNFEFYHGDIRNEKDLEKSLQNVDCVIHLASIVGDKPCQVAPNSAYQINYEGTIKLAELAKKKNIKKFIFASTCSNYGISDINSYATEETKLNPASFYAETKIDCEKFMEDIADENFATISLRFATAFGLSFRTRFDLTVNSFAYEAVTENKLYVFAAETWRPYIHVADMAQIIINLIHSEKIVGGNKVFNAGFTKQNHTKKELLIMLKKILPNLLIESISNEDPRNYKVSFKKLENFLKVDPTISVKAGFNEIIKSLKSNKELHNEFRNNNLESITKLFAKKEKLLQNY